MIKMLSREEIEGKYTDYKKVVWEKWMEFIYNRFQGYVTNSAEFIRNCPQLFEPFQDYIDNRCSLAEAQWILYSSIYAFFEECLVKDLEIAFEAQSSMKFSQTWEDLYGDDEGKAQKAAVELVKIFKGLLYTNSRIIELKSKASDGIFLSDIGSAFSKADIGPTGEAQVWGTKNICYFIFAKRNEDFIKAHIWKEIRGLAVKEGVISANADGEALRKHIRRQGIIKGKGGRPRKIFKEISPIQKTTKEVPPEFLKDWKFYLFGKLF